MNTEITLKLPIQIKPSINNDGYIITDANDTEHFFYNKEGSDDLIYDGRCTTVKDEDNKN